MPDLHTWLIVAVIALVTAFIRFLPFAVLSDGKIVPNVIVRLGNVLPYAIMGMLVVYCLKDINFQSTSGFVPELISCIVVGVSYVWKRKTLISIVCGTVCYMVLVQMVF